MRRSKTMPERRRPIFLRGVKVLAVATHKFLGVILDQELWWKEHIQYAQQKGTKWVTQYRRLAKPMKGVSAKHMRQFYISVAIPKMLYAADLFLIPGSEVGKGTKGFISKLVKIQRQATLHITGALRSTPTEVIDACTDIMPFHILVEKLTHRATTRLAMLPNCHPLVKHTVCVANRYVKQHRVPLHEILHTFKIHPNKFELIRPGQKRNAPASFATSIPATKEEAITEATVDRSEVWVFSDRLGQGGKIGTAAVLFRGGVEKWVVRKYMGTEEKHTIYKAELVRLSLAAELLKQEWHVQTLVIGADSQAVIQAIGHGRAVPG